ncbi:MAG: phenylalanine--tRNA ligase subunit beta [Gammaproteobacteria bacterium]|nr:phenylalanine--tRNA ligase subunit beta [Gammaproteobacteria bacterium]MCW5583641.1 phenylalanine--tRNA ligase subunit beta [Gammaproteobacteria bacterium]
MKCSESWLREWVNPTLTRDELCAVLTMAGLEVEGVMPVAKDFSGIVVGHILKVIKHPEADRLYVCEVDVGEAGILKIVCGADNVREGMKVPVAVMNATLPNNTVISSTNIKGIISHGMLCSATELGLAEESQGLLALSQDAPIGQDLNSYLKLDDYVIDISITPNRGDCLSVRGMAREISALTQSPLLEVEPILQKESIHHVTHTVSVEDKAGCPVYVGCVIRNVNADTVTPVWLKERLRRSGIRSISPIVDVTNYVMLELGQPMHAFDLDAINQGIVVRKSKEGEKIALLDGSVKQLDAETLIIADEKNPLAIAGVMGGIDSSVTLLTKDIFLESAFFTPQVVARQRQYYGITSESAYRFERGVDPTMQRKALERATQLIIEMTGGEASPVIEIKDQDYLTILSRAISLTQDKITRVLGVMLTEEKVEKIFQALRFPFKKQNAGWIVNVPLYRFDITLPEDLVEEIARLYGYDKIPMHALKAELQVVHVHGEAKDLRALRQLLSDLSYHEVISYSFIDKQRQVLLDPQANPCELMNPITADMAVMRTNLWPGLMNTFLYNKDRQQHRVRIFEIGTCFVKQDKALLQQTKLGGLITGLVDPEQWGTSVRETDFYDVKGDIEGILKRFMLNNLVTFKSDSHPALHPGQTAGIYHGEKKIGIFGALHPLVLQALDISGAVFVFEMDLAFMEVGEGGRFQEVAKFPEIRRDIAILVNQAIPARDIQDTIKLVAGNWLKDIFIFDVYQGKGILPGLKSIALALVLQHPTRTLVDSEVAALIERVISTLRMKLGAELRR